MKSTKQSLFIILNVFFFSLFFIESNAHIDFKNMIEIFKNRLANNKRKIVQGENVSQETEKFIRDIASKLQVKREFTIRKMDFASKQAFGLFNAFVYFDTVYVSESAFNQLSIEEKTFLIGHELTHLKGYHVEKKVAVYNILFLASYITTLLIMRKKFSNNYRSNYLYKTLGVFSSIGLTSYLLSAYSKCLEKEADIESIKILNSAKGGVKFFKRWQFLNPGKETFLERLFGSHPLTSERITYLENLAKKLINIK